MGTWIWYAMPIDENADAPRYVIDWVSEKPEPAERRRAARDKTVDYHWRVPQQFPDADRPSNAGNRARSRSVYTGSCLSPIDS